MAGGAGEVRRQRIARLALAGALLLLGLWVARAFLPALLWALVIAIAIDPLYARAEARWPRWRRHALPALATVALALAVLLPLAFGLLRAAHEAHELATWLAAARANGIAPPDWLAQLPFGRHAAADWWAANLATPEAAQRQFGHLSDSVMIERSRLLGTRILHHATIFAFTLVALFFMLRDKAAIAEQARLAGDRIFGPSGERVGLQIIRSVRGTIDGLVLVGIGEGVVMAVGYVVAGVPHPILLGALTAVAAMIPFGAALLIGAAAVLLLMQGAMGAAIAIMLLGLVVVAIADHAVRPLLIGGATRLPFLWVLIGILGGVEAFGLIGLFIGPAVMAALIMLWRELVGAAQPQPSPAGTGDQP
ncbi:AI-2E family transporter [Sphingomonas flavalba]|uniref:AI-2E family transporter n=1 Tax=Sphingomonas flavalba TaxID=2559804 RepID=UPI00109E0664|nr:AI-2E family transporter [Sphingomonas flavalba]